MHTTWERNDDNKVEFKITVSLEKVKEAKDRAYKRLSKDAKFDGFRKGKVPRAMIEARIGKMGLFNESLDDLLPEAYMEAVEQSKIRPTDQPEIHLDQAEEGKELIFRAIVPVMPEPTLGEYKGLDVTKRILPVGEDDVLISLNAMRDKFAQLVTVEGRAIATGDFAIIDFKGSVDGEVFEGGTAEDYTLEIGSGSFIDNFEDQLIGLSVGDEKDVEVNFPESYNAENLAGKPAVFAIKVKEIKTKELPELNDEFAKSASEFETMQELKADMLNKLEENAKDNARNMMEQELLLAVVDNANVDLTEELIDKQAERKFEQSKQEIAQQGATFEQYLEFRKMSEDEFKATLRPVAKQEIKTELVIDKLIDEESLKVSEEQIDAEIDKLAVMYKQEASFIKQRFQEQGSMSMIEENLLKRKVIEMIVDNAKIEEVVLGEPKEDKKDEQTVADEETTE